MTITERPRKVADDSTRRVGPTTPDGGALDPRLAHTILPADLLQGGEIVILLLKPSLWYIVLDALASLIWLTLLLMVLLVLQSWTWIHISRRDLVLLGVGMIGVRLFWQFLEWLGRVYVLTDRRVIRVRGVLRIHVFEAPLKQVQHTQIYLSIRERLFGLGTVGFATAGTGGYEAFWRMVANPLHVHRVVVKTIQRYT